MDLILMRHGKAEEQGTRQNDHERELTAGGRKKVAAAAQGLAAHFIVGRDVRIWSSPLPRARQTADIVAAALGNIPVQEYAALYMGDLDALLEEWGKIPPQSTLIMIGHEPYLSHWGARISGVVLPFKRASAASFCIGQHRLAQGELRWFAHAKVLAALGQDES
jgi:phosphohistidine phosphatase